MLSLEDTLLIEKGIVSFQGDCFDLLANSMMDSNCANVRCNEVSQCVEPAPFSGYW